MIMVLQYVSPVGYMVGNPDPRGKPTVPAWLLPYYMLNPLAGLIEASGLGEKFSVGDGSVV